MSAVWRCPVCEGVNRGGRTCSTCGATVPPGEPLRAAVRTRLPSTTTEHVPLPVPPTPRRRQLRELPPPEELIRMAPHDLFAPREGVEVRPLPGGCLVSFAPRRGNREMWP
jgi:hypothetical protein